MRYRVNNYAFTLVELLIVIAITLILAAAALPIYGNLQVSAQLNETTSQITQTLRIAQNNSLNRINSNTHGVKFEIDKFILYQGDSYSTRDSEYDRETQLDVPLSISTNLNGDEIVFTKSFGLPNSTGTVTLTHEVEGMGYILINDLGIIEEE